MKHLLFPLFMFMMISSLISQTYNKLYIPDTLNGSTFSLTIKDTFTQMRTGNQTITGAINNNTFWGPTLFVNKGDTVHMNVFNTLNDSTTLHWHGMHLPAVMDGGPHQVIPPGTSWHPFWKVTNNAATYWYHPHLHEMTMEHLTKGIGGLIIVRDAEEAALPLPRTYGIDDIPLVMTSRRFDGNNQFVVQDIAYGDYLYVNGTANAEYTIPKQVVRFRFLNAETERSYNIGFSDNRTFYVIGNDGGLLDAPVPVTRLHVAVGERYEILVDCTNDASGSSINLMAYNANQPFGFPGGEPAQSGAFGSLLNNKDFGIVHFTIGNAMPNSISNIPTTLVKNTFPTINDAKTQQSLSVMGGVPGNPMPFHFTGGIFNINRIDKTIPMNDIQKWTITNSNVFGHTFHIHDVQFKLVARNGKADGVGAYESGWKDVLYLPRSENATFVAKFDDYADPIHPFMYHCHFSNHEDGGMMGQFVVTPPTSVQEMSINPDEFNVYPNPAENRLFIESNGKEIYYVSIINILGKTVMMLPQPEISKGIDISALPKGSYTIIITEKNTKSLVTKQFVK